MLTTPIRVLVVEDDEDDFLIARRLLRDNRRASYEVTWAQTYAAGLASLRMTFDVCLVDYRLGPESGLSLIEQAIADGYQGPLILLTGYGDHDLDVEAMKAGASDYLAKAQLTPELMERVIRHSMERKAAEIALRRSEEQLRQSQKMEAIGSLAGGIAHDFNNLLCVILGYGKLLVDDLSTGHPMLVQLEEIQGAGMRAAALTRQLLAFSRQQVLAPRIVDMNEVVGGIENLLRRLIGEDIEFRSMGTAGLGRVMVDPGQMEQVIMNLAVNARDAMPDGGILTVETANVLLSQEAAAQLEGVSAGPHVMLSVTDTGGGMDAATQARMFEPFFTTKDIGKGTGLGLSTVFGIVQQSGGTIQVSSQVGQGTSFKVYLPVTEAQAPVSEQTSASAVDFASLCGPETVLVVEDEESVRVLVRAILCKYGYHVLDAQSGGNALVISHEYKGTIDLLLTDVVLPRMSGPDLALKLGVARPEIKVLFMSGYTTGAMLQQIHASGAPFLQKPITPEKLALGVRSVLDGAPNPHVAVLAPPHATAPSPRARKLHM